MRTFLLILVLACIGHLGKAQKSDPWTIYMSPNKVHDLLAGYIGEFEVEIRMWMDEKKAPALIKISSVNRMLLGKRFLEMQHQGQMMGMPYQATTIIGYNTISKTLDLTTMTNMGTGTLSLKGQWDATGKTANLHGQQTNPIDGKPIHVRQQLSFINSDTFLIENFDTYLGQKEKKSIEYRLVRKR